MDRTVMASMIVLILCAFALGAPETSSSAVTEKHSEPSEKVASTAGDGSSSIVHITTSAVPQLSTADEVASEPKNGVTPLPVATSTASTTTTTKKSGFSFDWPLQNLFP